MQDAGSAEHQAALAAVHRECAAQLLRLCQANGGVYIKAAQLVSTIQSVPKEYRECAPAPASRQRACRHCRVSASAATADVSARAAITAQLQPLRAPDPSRLQHWSAGGSADSAARAQDAGGAAGPRGPAAV